MNKRKILIPGADPRGQKLAKRIDAMFEIAGLIERDCSIRKAVGDAFPC